MKFAGIDGEAIDGRYSILAASNAPPLIRLNGLTTLDCLDYIRRLPNETIYCGYSLTYDIENWLRDLSDGQHAALRSGFSVCYGNYSILWMKGKYFELRWGGYARRRLYDLYTYFGCSFVEALEKALGVHDSFIEEFKQMRGQFSSSKLDDIVKYNHAECEYIAVLAKRIYEASKRLGLTTKKLYGPSALGAKILEKVGVEKKADDDLFLRAYYGGRFETFRFGHVGAVTCYDINSAYPHATKYLLEYDGLKRVKSYSGKPGIYHIKWRSNNRICAPFPFRLEDGTVIFPQTGSAWLWHWEIEAGAKICSQIDCDDGYELVNPRPFLKLYQMIVQLYRKRRRYVETFVEYIIKRTLASIYGKLSQSVGIGEYRRLDWASTITAITRAKLIDMMHDKLDRIVGCYTDSVYYIGIVNLDESKVLGGLKRSFYRDSYFIGNGIYMLEGEDGSRRIKTRGFRSLDWDRVHGELLKRRRVEVDELIFVGRGLTRIVELRDCYLQFVRRTKEISLESNRIKRDFEKIGLDTCYDTYAPIGGGESTIKRNRGDIIELDGITDDEDDLVGF